MWWWEFNKEEPLQEDLVVYEQFEDFRRDRERMDREKEEQKAKMKSGRHGTKYSIPDPI